MRYVVQSRRYPDDTSDNTHHSVGSKLGENEKVRPPSSSGTSNRLRSAIHQGQLINDINRYPTEEHDVGTDRSQELNFDQDGVDDTEERKVHGSRSSNPEVSLTTQSNSVDLIDSILVK